MRLLCMQPFPSGMLAWFHVPPWLRILPTLCILPASLTRFIIRRIIDRTHFLRLSAEAALRFLRMPRTPAPPKHKAQSTNHNAHAGQKQKKTGVEVNTGIFMYPSSYVLFSRDILAHAIQQSCRTGEAETVASSEKFPNSPMAN